MKLVKKGSSFIFWKQFSNWNKLVRVVALVLDLKTLVITETSKYI